MPSIKEINEIIKDELSMIPKDLGDVSLLRKAKIQKYLTNAHLK